MRHCLGAMLPQEDALKREFGNRRQSRGQERFASGDDHGFAAVPARPGPTPSGTRVRPQWGRCLPGRRGRSKCLILASAGRSVPEVPKRETVYDSKRPGVVVRLVSPSPRGNAWVYYLQKLRCNLCGAVSTPDLPPGAERGRGVTRPSAA